MPPARAASRLACLTAVLATAASAAHAAPYDDVDPFIGTRGDGSTFPGAAVPFGFAVPSPDTRRPSTAGFRAGGGLTGFSQTHVSGTGGASKYGNFRLTPYVGPLSLRPERQRLAEQRAEPGYYRARLQPSGIEAELTATGLMAFHRYRFPRTEVARLLLDVTSVIEVPGRQRITGSNVRLRGPRQLEGTVTVAGGWGTPREYRLHFAARLSRGWDEAVVFRGRRAIRAERATERAGRGRRLGVAMLFDASREQRLDVAVGLSFESQAQARANLRRELGGRGFEAVRDAARRRWEGALGRVTLEGGSRAQRRAFYTALYHSHLMPHDLRRDGRRGLRPGFEDFYALWDTFRTLHPLLTVLQPARQAAMVQALVDAYRETGWMPDARIAGVNALIQGGTNGDVVVADAAVKGLAGIDYGTAYEALVKNAETPSPRPLALGRELGDWLSLGYVSLSTGRSATRTLEYAYDDYAIAQVARFLGREEEARRYEGRSLQWANLWDPQTRMIRPRGADGAFLEPFDPLRYYPDPTISSIDAPYYEGNAWQWTTYVPHDAHGLVRRVGGDAAFTTWLDEYFDRGVHDPANEHDLLAPYLYIYAGRADRTQHRVRDLLDHRYSDQPAGLPGNDDAGALSAWYAWAAMGLYPNAGQPLYLISAPLFRSVRINLGSGRAFEVRAPAASPANRFIRSARLDGRPLDRAFIRHDELARGGVLELDLGSRPTAWGSRERPPSLSRRP